MASEESSSRAINRDDLRTGDHVYTWRPAGYGHHGIYVGKGMIIEFTTGDALNTIPSSSVVSKGTGAVGMRSWKDFRGTGGLLHRYEYGVSEKEFKERRSGTCTTARADDSPKLVKRRANYLLEHGYGGYDLLRHNCEDFALYCKTGLVVPEGSVGSSQGALVVVSGLKYVGSALAVIFNCFGFGAISKWILLKNGINIKCRKSNRNRRSPRRRLIYLAEKLEATIRTVLACVHCLLFIFDSINKYFHCCKTQSEAKQEI